MQLPLRRPFAANFLFVLIALLCSSFHAARPGGDKPVRLNLEGSIVKEDGTTVEEYELRESNPDLAHFVSIGMAAHDILKKAGYAYGPLLSIAHSYRDRELGEPKREEWFPMVVLLGVGEDAFEGGESGETAGDLQTYEATVSFNPMLYAKPGLAVLQVRKLMPNGLVEASFSLPLPEKPSFFDRNRRGITMMFGVIIASAVIKFLRKSSEKVINSFRESAAADGKPPVAGDGKAKSSESSTAERQAQQTGDGTTDAQESKTPDAKKED